MKIMSVFGTRPEAIKMCPIIIEMQKHKEIESVVCLTGQHKEMLDQVMDLFEIKADYNLGIMKERQTLTDITVGILQGLDEILKNEKPDVLLVHGDTTSSFVAALAAFYNDIPVGHVEAGLRTYDMKSPFPEEFNRQCVDLITDYYFAPTKLAAEQLMKEGKSKDKIYITGNTVIDALGTTVQDTYTDDSLKSVAGKKIILMTIHRRENIGEPMYNIFNAVKRIVDEYEDVVVVYPIHKNPKVRHIAKEVFADNDRILLIEPLGVDTFHNYIKQSFFVLTDSGGIQEEAPALGKPVLVAREMTERPEGVDAGVLKLVGTVENKVHDGIKALLENADEYERMSKANNPYGDGHASERIVDILLNGF
jgi:UDP-N-acetylglucosamine 2-epimerase (non-hydrolysing)